MSHSSTRTNGTTPAARMASVGGVRMDWKNDEVLKTLIEKGKEIRVAHLRRGERRPPGRRVRPGPPPGHPRTARQERHQRHRRRRRRGRARKASAALVEEVLVTDAEAPSFEDTDGDGRHIDDPVRMYLTQMGEIPCSTASRKSRSPARSNSPAAASAARCSSATTPCGRWSRRSSASTRGDLPFDRTIKVSQTENLEKDKILAADAAQPADARTADGAERRGLPAADRRADADEGAARSSASGSGSAAARRSRWSRNCRSARRRSSR